MGTNALVQPYVADTQQAAACPLFDPGPERDNRERFRRQPVERLRHANSFYVSNGLTPARGWVLLRRGDYDRLNPAASNLTLALSDDTGTTPDLALHSLAVVRADCVSRGFANDPDAVYLVELTDQQGLIYNHYFKYPTDSEYNIRAPAYPTASQTDPGGFYSASLRSGATTFTWDYLVNDLWAQMGPFLGAYPGLPFEPTESAEGWSFPGGSAWEALTLVLEQVGMTISVDLTNAAQPYGIVALGASDPNFSALMAKYAALKEDDWESPGFAAGRVPGVVRVYFHRRNQYYGTEETVTRGPAQWTMSSEYSVNVGAAAAGFPQYAGMPGVAFLWSELTVRFDVDGTPLPGDVTTATAVARERVGQYYGKIYRGSAGYLRQTYAGLVPFATGSLLDGVRWFQDYSAGRLAWRTGITRGYDPPWPETVRDLEVE
jgi:hypothetical protein